MIKRGHDGRIQMDGDWRSAGDRNGRRRVASAAVLTRAGGVRGVLLARQAGAARRVYEYIRSVAVPIDEDARRHNVFEELRTVMPAAGTTTDWTHLRIFRVKNLAAVDTFQAGMDAATSRVVPDEAQRKANSERSAGLRDAVRREVWTELR